MGYEGFLVEGVVTTRHKLLRTPRLQELACLLEKRTTTDEDLSKSALAFEAVTLEAGTYTISAPPLQTVNSSQRNYSDFFRNSIRSHLWIYDSMHQHCGTIRGMSSGELPAEIDDYALVLLSVIDQEEVSPADVATYRDHLPLEYPSSEEYYEEIYDTKHYSYKDCWALNILLMRWKDSVAERMAVGQMHADAWDRAHQQQRAIILA